MNENHNASAELENTLEQYIVLIFPVLQPFAAINFQLEQLKCVNTTLSDKREFLNKLKVTEPFLVKLQALIRTITAEGTSSAALVACILQAQEKMTLAEVVELYRTLEREWRKHQRLKALEEWQDRLNASADLFAALLKLVVKLAIILVLLLVIAFGVLTAYKYLHQFFDGRELTTLLDNGRLAAEEDAKRQAEAERLDISNWRTAQLSNSIQSFQAYIDRCLGGELCQYFDQAIAAKVQLEEDLQRGSDEDVTRWRTAEAANSITGYQAYLDGCSAVGHCQYRNQAQTGKSKLEQLQLDILSGTVNRGNLQWMRCSIGQIWTGSDCFGEASHHKWPEARAIRISYAGHTDWRLPTIEELDTLVHCSGGHRKPSNRLPDGKYAVAHCVGEHDSTTIDEQAFPNTPYGWFWSSSADGNSSALEWGVKFQNGIFDRYIDDSSNGLSRVRLVRDIQ